MSKPYLPYDFTRCTGKNSDTVCSVRHKCLRYLAQWREQYQSFTYKPDTETCEIFIEMKND